MTTAPPAARGPEGRRRRFRPTFAVVAFTVLSSLAVLPVLVLGLLESNQRETQLRTAFDSQAAQQAATVSGMLSQSLAGKAEVLTVTAGTLRALEEWHPEELIAVADAQLATTGSFDALYVADADGRSLIFAPTIRPDGTPNQAGIDYSDRSYYQELIQTKSVAYSHVQVGKASQVPNIAVAVPIMDSSDSGGEALLQGYVAAGIDVPSITRLVREAMYVEDGQRVLIVDSQKNVLVDSTSRLTFLEQVPSNTVWTARCASPLSGLEGLDESGTRVRLACAPLQLGQQTWNVFASSPTSVILKDVTTARASTFRFAAVALVLAIAVSGLLAVAIGQQMRCLLYTSPSPRD